MKRKTIVSLCVLLLALSVLSGCTVGKATGKDDSPSGKTSAAELTAYVVENNNGSLLVTGEEGLLFVSTDTATVEKDGKTISNTDLESGMTVKIGYSGNILETYPGRINDAETVLVVSQQADKVSLYTQALKYIFDDSEENKNKKTIAIDLTGISSLDESKKSAIEYLLKNYVFSFGEKNVIRSSYDELMAQGRITDDYNFDDGDGVIISLKENENDSFAISWWIGGLCASGCDNCTAKFSGGEWKINYTGFWIS